MTCPKVSHKIINQNAVHGAAKATVALAFMLTVGGSAAQVFQSHESQRDSIVTTNLFLVLGPIVSLEYTGHPKPQVSFNADRRNCNVKDFEVLKAGADDSRIREKFFTDCWIMRLRSKAKVYTFQIFVPPNDCLMVSMLFSSLIKQIVYDVPSDDRRDFVISHRGQSVRLGDYRFRNSIRLSRFDSYCNDEGSMFISAT